MRSARLILLCAIPAVALCATALPPPPYNITARGDYYLPQSYSFYSPTGRAYQVDASAAGTTIDGKGFGVYNPAGGKTLAVGFDVYAARVSIRNVEVRGFHQLARS